MVTHKGHGLRQKLEPWPTDQDFVGSQCIDVGPIVPLWDRGLTMAAVPLDSLHIQHAALHDAHTQQGGPRQKHHATGLEVWGVMAEHA